MEAKKKREIKEGLGFVEMFPNTEGENITIKRGAGVEDTMEFIPKVVKNTLFHTKRIASRLKGRNVAETCKNIWEFVYDHIDYKKDESGYEQVRSPARSWRDRKRGVDCDCYSVFISSVLTNLGIPHVLRITKYWKNHYQHIYPIVPYDKGYITIDCVPDEFNHEVPFSRNKDYPMDLQYLNGTDNEMLLEPDVRFSDPGTTELGKLVLKDLFKKVVNILPPVAAVKAVTTVVDTVKSVAAGENVLKAVGQGVDEIGKDALNTFNSLNPVMIAPRLAWKSAMEINMMNVARRLRYAYLPAAEAEARGMDMDKFPKLASIMRKLEDIYYAAGGDSNTLKEAILKGQGNKDGAVPFSGIEGSEMGAIELAAITGMIATLAGLITALGPLFKSGSAPGATDFIAGDSTADAAVIPTPVIQDPAITAQPLLPNVSQVPASNVSAYTATNSQVQTAVPTGYQVPVQRTSVVSTTTTTDEKKESFFKKHPWVLPVGIGVIVIGIGAFIVLKKKKETKVTGLKGISGRDKKRKRHAYTEAIELQ